MPEFRKELDSLGEIDVPADKLWGARTPPSPRHCNDRKGQAA